jgi:predicted RNA binding protein YcfA (HicA-like mRNA interferase family)
MSDTRKLIKALEDQGFEVVRSKGNHYVVKLDGRRVATLASTPSDSRSLRNGIAALRRAGFRWPR